MSSDGTLRAKVNSIDEVPESSRSKAPPSKSLHLVMVSPVAAEFIGNDEQRWSADCRHVDSRS